MNKAEILRRIKTTLWFYEECLKGGLEDVSSPLSFQQEIKALLSQLGLESDEAEQLQRRFEELNQRWHQMITAHPRQYRNRLKKELAAELRIIEADLDLLPRLSYEEALRTWVAVEAAGHLLAELERIADPAQVKADRARHESLWRELEARIAALPEEAEARRARPVDLPAPPPALTLPEVLAAVRHWTPADRRVLRQELEREYLYETVGPEAGRRAIAEERAAYSSEESEVQTGD